MNSGDVVAGWASGAWRLGRLLKLTEKRALVRFGFRPPIAPREMWRQRPDVYATEKRGARYYVVLGPGRLGDVAVQVVP